MVDIHSHVLYGVDDGARTMEDSLAMLRMAAEHGTTDIVATPHASPDFAFQPEVNRERLAAERWRSRMYVVGAVVVAVCVAGLGAWRGIRLHALGVDPRSITAVRIATLNRARPSGGTCPMAPV